MCLLHCRAAAAAVAAIISSPSPLPLPISLLVFLFSAPTPYFFPPPCVFCLFVLRQFFVCRPGLVSVMRSTQLLWSMFGLQVWATVLSSVAFCSGGRFLSSLSALAVTFRGHLDSSFSRPYVTSAAVPFATAVGVTGCRPWSVDSLRKCYLSTTVGSHYHLKVWLLRNDR